MTPQHVTENVLDGALIGGMFIAPWWWGFLDFYGHAALFVIAVLAAGLRAYSWWLDIQIKRRQLSIGERDAGTPDDGC